MKKLFITTVLLIMGVKLFAQKQGEWRIRLCGTYVVPDASATISTIGGSVDISKSVIPELDFTYFLVDRVSANLILGTTKNKVTATNTSLGDVPLGHVWLLPPTLTFLYHQPLGNGILPYIGAGVNYTIFYSKSFDAPVTDISYKNRFGFATQIGSDFDISKKWFINIDAKKIWLKTKNTVQAAGATVYSNTKINPWLFSLGVGVKL
ncbi:OmpW family protein [Arachidicoccus ginsenosidimutans]|uniref:OmpW/AlkL family protein n=1 Tax=Arachidicoccus sp. BS20 TaxID=1850526 RepID=UPI0007F15E07|nr:OmpW family outer membrane protein [Arachidicoccus sp. BS20]ANI88101.1 OmpW family protein [Arachidicoccus sp. BS20]